MNKFESREGKLFIDGKKVIKGWESFNGWYWFATEIQDEGLVDLGDGDVETKIYFGFVQGFDSEWGSFCEAELDEMIAKNKVWEIPQKALEYSGRRD